MHALNVLCAHCVRTAQLTRDLFAIAKFLLFNFMGTRRLWENLYIPHD